MTPTATAPARANRDGHPCPSWCVIDHDEELIPGHFAEAHGGERLSTSSGGACTRMAVSAMLAPSRGIAEVHVSGAQKPMFIDGKQAEGLACLAELLADATPEQHRELAAAIRQAAAVITGADGG